MVRHHNKEIRELARQALTAVTKAEDQAAKMAFYAHEASEGLFDEQFDEAVGATKDAYREAEQVVERLREAVQSALATLSA